MQIFYLLLVLQACKQDGFLKKYDDKLILKNNSDKELLYYILENYPDTINFEICSGGLIQDKIKPLSEGKCIVRGQQWEDYINKMPSKKIVFYLYDADTFRYYINKYGCSYFNSNPEYILKRIPVDIEYLNGHNWTVYYP